MYNPLFSFSSNSCFFKKYSRTQNPQPVALHSIFGYYFLQCSCWWRDNQNRNSVDTFNWIGNFSWTHSNSCGSTSWTRNCSSSSTITCSCWSRKSTRERRSPGPSSISASTCNLVSNSSRRSLSLHFSPTNELAAFLCFYDFPSDGIHTFCKFSHSAVPRYTVMCTLFSILIS